MLRGALAGIVAAAAWAAAEPAAGRVFRVPAGYSDVRLLGGVLTADGPSWQRVGLAAHLANGQPDRTRPLCPYPQVATFKGSGSTDDAANFVCK